MLRVSKVNVKLRNFPKTRTTDPSASRRPHPKINIVLSWILSGLRLVEWRAVSWPTFPFQKSRSTWFNSPLRTPVRNWFLGKKCYGRLWGKRTDALVLFVGGWLVEENRLAVGCIWLWAAGLQEVWQKLVDFFQKQHWISCDARVCARDWRLEGWSLYRPSCSM